MIQKSAYISAKVFDEDVDQAPTRDGYGEGLLEAGEKYENVVALCADLTESTRTHLFAEKFPKRFFQMGVAEQNMNTVAAGLGISGKIPFVASYATFSPGRAVEQIRTTIAYNDSNVKIAGHHAGISVGPDGATHQALEDVAIMRSMPNMRVIVPVDSEEARKATLEAVKIKGPIYLRFAREKTPVFTTKKTPFRFGRAEIFFKASKPKVAIIGAGPILHNALVAAKELKKEKINTVVINCHTIKPLDEKTILKVVKEVDAVVTVEEHQVTGGLGGAIAELLAKEMPKKMGFIGMQDCFGESGSPEELIKKYGMDSVAIKKKVKQLLGK